MKLLKAFLKRRKNLIKKYHLNDKHISGENVNAFFKERYGTVLGKILFMLSFDFGEEMSSKYIKLYFSLNDAIIQRKPIVFICPLRSGLFNFYFARGIKNQLKLDGYGKVYVKTVNTYLLDMLVSRQNKEEFEKDIKSIVKPNAKYIFLDYIESGKTYNMVKNELRKHMKEVDILPMSFNDTPNFKGRSPRSFIIHKPGALSTDYVKNRRVYKYDKEQSKIKEMLFFAGRFWYKLMKQHFDR